MHEQKSVYENVLPIIKEFFEIDDNMDIWICTFEIISYLSPFVRENIAGFLLLNLNHIAMQV